MPLMAREGEIVTCENGHELYRVTRDIRAGETCNSIDFQGIDPVPNPINADKFMSCYRCDAKWWRFLEGGGIGLHVGGQWRGDGVYLDDSGS